MAFAVAVKGSRRPSTCHGRRARESPHIQPKLRIGPQNDRFEQEADRVADQVMRMPEHGVANFEVAPPAVQRTCTACEEERAQRKCAACKEGEVQGRIQGLRGGGKPLSADLRAFFEPRFGRDFGDVRIHTGARAAETAAAINARAYTVGRNVAFAAGEFAPASRDGKRLLAHELTHVVQQQHAGKPSLQRDSELKSFPEDERKKVQRLAGGISAEVEKAIDKIYLEKPAYVVPAERKVQFAPSVPEFRRKRLESVAAALTTPFDADSAAMLPRNTTFALAIPAAKAIFRLTRFDRPSTRQAGATGPMPEVVLIEQLGEIPDPPKPLWEVNPGPFSDAQGPLPAPERQRMEECLSGGADLDYCRKEVLGIGAPAPAPVVLPADKVEIRTVKVRRGAGWNKKDWEAVAAALASLPDSALKLVSGTKFLRKAAKTCTPAQVTAKTCDPNRAAETDAVNNTIVVFDHAFERSTTRYGTSEWLHQAIVHEVGHLADYKPLGRAWRSYKRRGGKESRLLSARSRSGSAWVKSVRGGKKRFNYTEIGGGVTAGSFREAAIQDGLQVTEPDKQVASGGVTKYGETSWRELFAESFALYMTAPDLLEAIRPNVYAYLVGKYPEDSPP